MKKLVIVFLILFQTVVAQAAEKYSQVKNTNSNKGGEEVGMYKGLDGVGQWHAMGEKDDVKLFYSDVKGSSFEAFKAETVVTADLKTLVSMLQDTDRMHEWMYSTKSVTIINQMSDTESIRYLVNEIPYPFMKDRDLVVHSSITQSDTGTVSIRMTKKEGIRGEVSGMVRIPRLDTIVDLQSLRITRC